MIPIVPVSGRRDAFASGPLQFEDGIPCFEPSCDVKEALTAAYGMTSDDDPIILLDVDGFSSRFLNGEVIKEIRIKKRDLWLVTYIENIEDVINALSGSFSGVGIPLNTVDDEDVLIDACSMSESVFPVAFMESGRGISTGKTKEGIITDAKRLDFSKVLFINTDSLTAEVVQLGPSETPEI